MYTHTHTHTHTRTHTHTHAHTHIHARTHLCTPYNRGLSGLAYSWSSLGGVWHSFHIFSVCEKLSVHSRVKTLHSSCFLYDGYGCALHGAMYRSEAHVLYLVLDAVAHALALYSSVGRTVPVYAVFRFRGDAPQCVQESRFSRASFLMPLFLLNLICSCIVEIAY